MYYDTAYLPVTCMIHATNLQFNQYIKQNDKTQITDISTVFRFSKERIGIELACAQYW